MSRPASRVCRVVVTGPLAPFADAYGAELRRRGYTALTTVNELRQVARLSRWLEAGGLTSGEQDRDWSEECRGQGEGYEERDDRAFVGPEFHEDLIGVLLEDVRILEHRSQADERGVGEDDGEDDQHGRGSPAGCVGREGCSACRRHVLLGGFSNGRASR